MKTHQTQYYSSFISSFICSVCSFLFAFVVCTKHSMKIESGRVYTTRNAHSILHATHFVNTQMRTRLHKCKTIPQNWHFVGSNIGRMGIHSYSHAYLRLDIVLCECLLLEFFFFLLFWRFFCSFFCFRFYLFRMRDPWIGPDRKLEAQAISVYANWLSVWVIFKGFSAYIPKYTHFSCCFPQAFASHFTVFNEHSNMWVWIIY